MGDPRPRLRREQAREAGDRTGLHARPRQTRVDQGLREGHSRLAGPRSRESHERGASPPTVERAGQEIDAQVAVGQERAQLDRRPGAGGGVGWLNAKEPRPRAILQRNFEALVDVGEARRARFHRRAARGRRAHERGAHRQPDQGEKDANKHAASSCPGSKTRVQGLSVGAIMLKAFRAVP